MIQLHSVLESARATVNDHETALSMNPAKIRNTHIPNSSGTATVTCVDNVACERHLHHPIDSVYDGGISELPQMLGQGHVI
jgi:hypothetical protein